MRIEMPVFTTAIPNLSEAIDISNRILQGEGDFFREIREIPSFRMSKNKITKTPVRGAEVAEALAQDIFTKIALYTPRNHSSAANGYTNLRSTVIYLNELRVDRPTEELVATLIHECVHIADRVPNLSFGHGSNWRASKKGDTAPYRIEQIAQRIASTMRTHRSSSEAA